MSKIEMREESRFTAKDDSGTQYALVVYRDYIVTRRSESRHETPGMRSIKTIDGQHVDLVSYGKYRIVGSNIDLTSDGPPQGVAAGLDAAVR
jgi:hypothetical protein